MANKEELKKVEQEVKEFTDSELDEVNGGFLRKVESTTVSKTQSGINTASKNANTAKSAVFGEVGKQ